MHIFWEGASGHFLGFLKTGEFQKFGIDLHGSYPRSKKLPHISVYQLENNKWRKMKWSLQIRNVDGGIGLKPIDRKRLLRLINDEKLIDEFIREVCKKHIALYPQKKSSTQQAAFKNDDFPALPVITPAVRETPAVMDPVQAQLEALPEEIRSVVEGTGIFNN